MSETGHRLAEVTARALIAIVENFQDEGGKVAVPDVLKQFGAP